MTALAMKRLLLVLVPLLWLALGPWSPTALALDLAQEGALAALPSGTPHSFVAEAARAVAPAVVRIDTPLLQGKQIFRPESGSGTLPQDPR